MNNAIQPLIPKTIHTTLLDKDYVAPTTKSILDELLEEFRDEILNVTMVDEEADFNPAKDIEELKRLLTNNIQSHFTEIHVHSVIIKPDPFIHTQPMSPLYEVFKTSKSSTKPYKFGFTDIDSLVSLVLTIKSSLILPFIGKDHGRIILNSVENGPLVWYTVKQEDDIVRLKTYEELFDKKKLQANCDQKAINIILQGLPPNVYSLNNHHKVTKDIWDRVKLLMKGTSLSKQERECKMYEEYDKFSHFSPPTQHVYSSPPQSNPYGAPHHPQQYPTTYPTNLSYTQPFVTQNAYPPLTIAHQPQAEFPQLDSGLAVPTFLPYDDLIACMNKAIAFLSAVFSPCYPSTNKQLESSSNPRNQATIQDGRVTVQQVQGRQEICWFSVLSQREEGMHHGLRKILGFVQDQHRPRVKNMDEEHYISRRSWIANAKAVLMANLSSFDSDVLSELNKLSKDFGKCFVPQQELSTEQMFWLQISNKNSEEPSTSNIPVKIEVLSELPKLSLVNKSLKKLRFHLASFDKVVKVRTTPDAITDGSWGFEHTKKVFLTEIIPWLNKLKDLFKEFDKGLHDEITEVQIVFTQMEAAVEQCSVDRKYLKAQIQEKVFANTLLKNELRKLKGKNVIDAVVSKLHSTTIAPGMFKFYLEPLAPKVLKNKDAHIDYIKHSREHADTLREIVESARALSPLDSNLDSTCKYVQRIQEMLVYVRDTCPCLTRPSEKLVVVILENKDKKVRFADPITSSNNTQKQVNSHKILLGL
ncbi:hypothetical protein Tco_0744150 [Tanacetum coccineum]